MRFKIFSFLTIWVAIGAPAKIAFAEQLDIPKYEYDDGTQMIVEKLEAFPVQLSVDINLLNQYMEDDDAFLSTFYVEKFGMLIKRQPKVDRGNMRVLYDFEPALFPNFTLSFYIRKSRIACDSPYEGYQVTLYNRGSTSKYGVNMGGRSAESFVIGLCPKPSKSGITLETIIDARRSINPPSGSDKMLSEAKANLAGAIISIGNRLNEYRHGKTRIQEFRSFETQEGVLQNDSRVSGSDHKALTSYDPSESGQSSVVNPVNFRALSRH